MDAYYGSVDFTEIFENRKKGFIVDETALNRFKKLKEEGRPVLSFNTPNYQKVLSKKAIDRDYNISASDVWAYDKIVFYSVEYALLFTPVINSTSLGNGMPDIVLKIESDGKNITLADYYINYEVGFFQGISKFNSKYRPTDKEILGSEREVLVKVLQHLYFNAVTEPASLSLRGVSYVKNNCMGTGSPEMMRYEGLNSGLTYAIEKYVRDFEIKDFYKDKNSDQELSQDNLEEKPPKTFEELFYNNNLVAPSIDILKELDPPFIDTECNYIGKLKGIVCVWVNELQRQSIIKHYSDRKIFSELIPQKIKRFSIDESMFGKPQTRAENRYRNDIRTKVSQIKLSQDSQKGKMGK